MQAIDRWLEFFNKQGIQVSHSIHHRAETALATAVAERVPAHEFAKTVVYFSNSGFGIAVVPADQFVDLTKVARVMGLSYIRLADEGELQGLFPDCEIGAMPPFGETGDLPVVVDVGLVGEYVAFTLGTHQDVVRLRYVDFELLARPTTASIAVGHEVVL